MATVDSQDLAAWHASDQPFATGIFLSPALAAETEGKSESIEDMARKQKLQKPAGTGVSASGQDEVDPFEEPAGTGASAEILASIDPPEFMNLKPGQVRPLGRNASIPVEFVSWIEEVQDAFGFSSFSDATLYLLCVAAKIPFQSVSSRRGFAAATKKELNDAIRKRIARVHEKMRAGTWVGRGPMKKPGDEVGG